jgi:hypothetical protein
MLMPRSVHVNEQRSAQFYDTMFESASRRVHIGCSVGRVGAAVRQCYHIGRRRLERGKMTDRGAADNVGAGVRLVVVAVSRARGMCGECRAS